MAYTPEQLAIINEWETSVDGTPIDLGAFFNGELVEDFTWNDRQTLIDALFTRVWYRIEQRYLFPAGGIPTADLSASVQIALNNANTAYQLPVGGIPEADLSAAVQTKLNQVYSDSWEDPVNAVVDLPLVGNTLGDVRLVTSTGEIYTWTGVSWVVSTGVSSGGFFDPATWMMV
jgi:hypothetical protein